MPVSIATFGASFIKYLPGVVKTINQSTTMNKIALGDIKWEGTQVQKTVQVGVNTSIANVQDGGALPVADQQAYVPTWATRKNIVGSVQVTDGILKNANTTANAAIKVTESELRGLMDTIKFYKGFFFPRDGTGVVATLGVTTAGATISVSDGRGFVRGGRYEIRNSVTGAVITAFTVASKARGLVAGEAVITPTAPVGVLGQVTGDFVSWGVTPWSSYGQAITGLDRLISAAGIQGMNVALYPQWTSPVYANGGIPQNITSLLFRQVQATAKQEAPEGDPNTGWVVYTDVWDGINVDMMFEHNMRLTPDSSVVGIKGGMTFQSALGKVTVMTDPWTPYGTMFFINPKSISRLVQSELDWREGGLNGIFQRSDAFLGYTASCLEISELMILERSSNAKITNLRNSPQTAY